MVVFLESKRGPDNRFTDYCDCSAADRTQLTEEKQCLSLLLIHEPSTGSEYADCEGPRERGLRRYKWFAFQRESSYHRGHAKLLR